MDREFFDLNRDAVLNDFTDHCKNDRLRNVMTALIFGEVLSTSFADSGIMKKRILSAQFDLIMFCIVQDLFTPKNLQ